MGNISSAFRLTKVIKRVAAALLLIAIVLYLGPSGCGETAPGTFVRSSGTVYDVSGNTAQTSGSTPCMDSKTGRCNPLSYMDVADTGGGNVNSGRFGLTRNGGTRFHAGIDLDAEVGTSVHSVADGTVVAVYSDAKWDGTADHESEGGGYGNYVLVRSVIDGREVDILYAHLDVNGVGVRPGQTVSAGSRLGRTGRTGNAWNVANPHLHFEVRDTATGKAVNPEPYLNGQVSESGAFVNVACDNRDISSTMVSGK